MEKISVIIPVYNAEKYLSICIESILRQTYSNWEAIIVDDGSTDNSKNICEKYSKQDDRIKIFSQTNKGVSATRNFGINKAIGNYIVFVDADDWLESNFLERMFETIEREKADIVQCNFYYAKENENIRRKHIVPSYSVRTTIEELQLDILFREYEEKKYHKSVGAIRAVWGKLFRTSLIKNKKFNEKLDIFEDGIFILNTLQDVKKMILIDEYLYYYRITEDSSNIKYKPNFDQKAIAIIEQIQHSIMENNKSKEYEECFYIMIFEMISTTLEKDIFNIRNNASKKEKINRLKNLLKNNYCKRTLEKIKIRNLENNQKILYFLLKVKGYIIIYYLYSMKQKIKKRKIIR